MTNKPSITIGSILSNNETILTFSKNDIIVFVGPNNVGKSRILKDIDSYSHNMKLVNEVIIKNIKYINENTELLKDYLKNSLKKDKNNIDHYIINSGSIHIRNMDEPRDNNVWYLKDLFINLLNTEDRLLISNPIDGVSIDETSLHPLQILFGDERMKNSLNNYFMKTFNKNIVFDNLTSRQCVIRIGENFDNVPSKDSEAIGFIAQKYNKMALLRDQGDGMRSFVGVILSIIRELQSVVLIDEPESFLHPPQAYIMGKSIAEISNNRTQVFIATHSLQIIQGLLDNARDRLKIIRIEREDLVTESINKMTLLSSEDISEIINEPILRHTNILDALFHTKVIICESDSDSSMYKLMLSSIREKNQKYVDEMFIQTYGKQKIHKVVKTLRKLNIDTKVIVDIDMLNNEKEIKELVISFSGNWENIKDNYIIVKDYVDNIQTQIKKGEIVSSIGKIAEKIKGDYFEKKDFEAARKLLIEKTGWKDIKRRGVKIFRKTEVLEAFNMINQELKKLNIHLVEVGELETFIQISGDIHGPKWVNTVLEKYPNLDNDVYDGIKDFLSSIGL